MIKSLGGPNNRSSTKSGSCFSNLHPETWKSSQNFNPQTDEVAYVISEQAEHPNFFSASINCDPEPTMSELAKDLTVVEPLYDVISEPFSSRRTEFAHIVFTSQTDITFGAHNDNHERNDDDVSETVVQHGFTFGKRSISFDSVGRLGDVTNDSMEEENEDNEIGEIYSSSRDSAEFSLNDTERLALWPVSYTDEELQSHMFSKRIVGVGQIGQHLGLGHQLGVLLEDTELLPKCVNLESTEYVIEEKTPVQIDIKWSKAENMRQFKNFMFEIELKSETSADKWMSLASVRFPIFRAYHTDDKLILGKMQFSRKKHDLLFKLRIQSRGDIVLEGGSSYTLTSAWSKEITLLFLGYESNYRQVETTSL